MRMRLALLLPAAVLTLSALVPAAAMARPDAPGPRADAARGGAVVQVQRSRYGRILFDGRGRVLYLFTRDRRDRSRCSGACAQAWPVFTTGGRPRAGRGANARLVGSIRRADGRRQVTYAGHPLYYYVADRAPGQITCQDVREFGGLWLVVRPDGRAVR